MPSDWMKQIIVPLHKRGAYNECDNFRGIALFSIPGKVFRRVIQNRMKKRVDSLLRESQYGFRKDRGCAGVD